MPFGPYYAALPVSGSGKRYVDQASWDAIVDNFVNWKGDVNAGGHRLSNVVMEFTDLSITDKLGVGVATPVDALHVQAVDGPVAARLAVLGDSTSATHRPLFSFRRLASNGGATPLGARMGALAWFGADGDGEFVAALLDSYHDGTLARAADLRIFTNPGGPLANGLERLRITSSGNIGIGFIAPEDRLTFGELSYAPSESGPCIRWQSSGGELVYRMGARINASGVGRLAIDGYSGVGTYTERFCINDSGYVGIGANNPQARLEVRHTGQTAADFNAGTDSGLALRDVGANVGNGGSLLFGLAQGFFAGIKGYAIDGGSGDGRATGHMVFAARRTTSDAALTEVMRITSQGNVGIGGYAAADPISRLSLGNRSDYEPSILQRIAVYEAVGGVYFRGIGFCRLGDPPGTLGFGLGFWGKALGTLPNHNNPDMIVNDAGNVGIGATSPTHRLHVAGAMRFESDSMDFGNDAATIYMYWRGTDYAIMRAGVNEMLRLKGDGRMLFRAPNSAPTDSHLLNGMVSIWFDEGNNRLAFRCKTSAGVLKTGYLNVA